MLEHLTADTNVTCRRGEARWHSTVVATVPVGDRTAVLVAETPFHPVDQTWPDHPADVGTLTVDAREYAVADCVMGAVDHDAQVLRLGTDIPVRRSAPGWTWVVAHLIDGHPDIAVGSAVELRVDEETRHALSAGHTACELATFALNAALSARWRKEVAVDQFGSPDFDTLAIATSKILPYGSRDEYRLGKSLRKRGFVADGLADDLGAITQRIEEMLAEWIRQDARIWVDAPERALSAVRTWKCALDSGEVSELCGGTHLASTGALRRVTVALDLSPDRQTLEMTLTAG